MEKLYLEDRLKLKIKELKKYLNFLVKNLPKKMEDYEKDDLIKAACERYFEKIVKLIIDVGFLIVKVNKTRIPLLDEPVFDVLAENKIISDKLSKKLSNARSMRNFIIHQYGGIDDKKVFISIKNELIPDVREFLREINKL